MPLTEHLMDQTELFDLANDAIILTDNKGAITYWNRGACRTYGWEKEEALGQKFTPFFKPSFPERRGISNRSFTRSALGGRTRSGSPGWKTNPRREPMDDRRGKLRLPPFADQYRYHGAAAGRNGVTRERGALSAFRDPGFTGTLSILPNGQIVTCNPAFANIFGFDSIEEAISGNFLELLRSRKDGAELLEMVRQNGIVERHELEMRRRGGDPVYVVARLVGAFAEGELTDLQVYLFNDTKRKRLEQQLIQAQKMEGLGTLAGGIAHDFNNILAIILGYTNRLETLDSKAETSRSIKIIKEAVERGAALVQQLLTSARQTRRVFRRST